jgi:hypothetical protein
MRRVLPALGERTCPTVCSHSRRPTDPAVATDATWLQVRGMTQRRFITTRKVADAAQ